MSKNNITFSEAIIPLTMGITVIVVCIKTWPQDHRITYSFIAATILGVILIATIIWYELSKERNEHN